MLSQESVASSQESTVQATPSLQSTGVPAWQPAAGSHVSTPSQNSPLSQFGAGPPTHAPPAQVSDVVQASPSSQAAVLLAFTQPLAGSQESSVQTLPSSQLGSAPPTHAPAAQVSAVVQALPSSQAAVLLAFTQPVPVSQESSVQTLPSSQLMSVNTHIPSTHASVVQASMSSQMIGVFTHTPSTHESSVQGSMSSQSISVNTQTPSIHASSVQGSLSPQSASD